MPIQWLQDLLQPLSDAGERALQERVAQDLKRNGWNLAGKGASAQYKKTTLAGGSAPLSAASLAPPPRASQGPVVKQRTVK